MNLYIMQIVLFCFYKGIYNNYKYRISRDEYNMINIEYFIRSRKYTSGLPSVLYGPHIDHFVSICKDRKREGEKERQDERRISERMNGEKEVRGRRKKTKSDCSSNSMRGRFGSPIFGPEHFQAHPLRPLQTRPPPRIELSVQISILTANLPANSPLLLISSLPRLFSPSQLSS